MKTLSRILCTIIAFLIGGEVMAQPGHGAKPPRIQVPRVISNPHVNIHANSNTVFRTPSSQGDNKKNSPKREEVKKEVNDKQAPQKKEKKSKR